MPPSEKKTNRCIPSFETQLVFEEQGGTFVVCRLVSPEHADRLFTVREKSTNSKTTMTLHVSQHGTGC